MTNATTAAKASAKVISGKLELVRTTGDKYNALLHETAMLAAKHALAFGDAQFTQALVMSMPASMRRKMMILWFATYTPVVVKDSADWVAKLHKPDSKLYVAWNLEDGEETPFWMLAEQNPEKSYSFAELVKMVARLAKTIEKKVEDGKVPPEDIASAEGIVTVLSGLHFNPVKPVIEAPSNNNTATGSEITAGDEQTLAQELEIQPKLVVNG